MWMYRPFIIVILLLGFFCIGVAAIVAGQQMHTAYVSLRHLVFFFLLGLLLNTISSRLPGKARRFAMAYFAPLLLVGPVVATLIGTAAGLLVLSANLVKILIDAIFGRNRKAAASDHSSFLLPHGNGTLNTAPLGHLLGIAQAAVAIMCAGHVYLALGGEIGKVRLPYDLLAVGGAALTMLLIEAVLGETAAALRQGRPVLSAWRNDLIYTFPMEGSFIGLGLLLVLLYQQSQRVLFVEETTLPLGIVFVAFVILIPCWLLYYSYRLFLEMREAYSRTLRTLATLVEARLASASRESSNPGEKTRWLAECAAAIAEQMGLPAKEVDQVRFAAYLLEVGKIGLPRALLTKNFFASPRQRKAYCRHVELANQILEPVEFLRPVGRLICHHQERFDGLGYPHGLHGEEIPLGSRILACAQAFVGLTKGTEDTSALSVEAALEQLYKNKGIRFDPKVLNALVEVLRHRGLLSTSKREAAAVSVSPSVISHL